MSNSTTKKSACKVPENFRKPENHPLSVHRGTGYWMKKISGRQYYFGKVSDDPKGVAALELWLAQKDDLLAGREPCDDSEKLSVGELVSRFLSDKQDKRDGDELSPRTFRNYFDYCAIVIKTFSKTRAVTDLRPDDFRLLRSKIASGRGPGSIRLVIQQVRSLFLFAFDEGLIKEPIRYGKAFQKPTIDVLRRDRENHREKHGDRMFESAEILKILAASSQPMRSMVLLAANCAFGQSDISNLPIKAVDLDKGWVDFARVKNAIRRRIPLWDETIQSIREWLEIRPEARNPEDDHRVYLKPDGRPWVQISKSGNRSDAIGWKFSKVLTDLNLKRPKVGFYSLRHTFETIGGESRDQVAVDYCMGHIDGSMSAMYRERISDERLKDVVNVVREWLFSDDQQSESEYNKSIG